MINFSFPLDRRLAKRQMWNIVTGRYSSTFRSFQNQWGSELVTAKCLRWNLFYLSEGKWSNHISQWLNSGKIHYKQGFSFKKYDINSFQLCFLLKLSINLGASPNHECWRHDISAHPSWSRPVCSRATSCNSKIYTRMLSRIPSSARLQSIHRSTSPDVHPDPSAPSARFSKDMWRNQKAFGWGWRDQLTQGQERAPYLGSEFFIFFDVSSGAWLILPR